MTEASVEARPAQVAGKANTANKIFPKISNAMHPFGHHHQGIDPTAPQKAGGNRTVAHAAPTNEDEGFMTVFLFLKIIMVLSAIYMCASTWGFFYDADTGHICPKAVICAKTTAEKTLLSFSRLSAGAIYPALAISVFSKCYATKAFLHHSWVGAVIDIEPTHDIHTYFGLWMLFAGVEHGVLHTIRYAIGGDADLLYKTAVGRSGVICTLLLFPIVMPMKYKWIKDRVKFETRKSMHMLFMAMIIALCFHSYVFRWVGAILLCWYSLDRFYYTTKQTFLIEHPTFEAVGRGTMVGLDLPKGYTFKAGSYIYINCPAISRGEWHPFSILPVPGNPSTAAFYAEVVGDWTQDLFRLGLEHPRLPLWITTAQPSSMDKTIYYDHVVLVSTGAGITPAISIAQRFAQKKNIHLLWITRDGGMVALFEKQLRMVASTVYLTGKPDAEVKLALTKLLSKAESEIPSNSIGGGLESTGSGSFGGRRPSVLGMSRASFMIRGPSSSHGMDTQDTITEGDEEEEKDEAPLLRGMPQAAAVAERQQAAASAVAAEVGIPTPAVAGAPSPGPESSAIHARTVRLRSNSDVPTRRKSISPPTEHPVKLIFGRPDIKQYLEDTFNGVTEESEDVEGGGKRGFSRQTSTRLSGHQQKSKQILLAADKTMIESCKRTGSTKDSVNPAAVVGSSMHGGDIGGMTPLVLYCGANPRVEAVIDSTCTENNVPWQKEYFGAW